MSPVCPTPYGLGHILICYFLFRQLCSPVQPPEDLTAMKMQSSRPCWNLWKFRATAGKYWSGWGQTSRTKRRGNVWAVRSQSLNMPTTTRTGCAYALIPRLVLTAAAHRLLTACNILYGHVTTNKTKENQQSKTCRTVRCSMNRRTDGAWFHICLYPRPLPFIPTDPLHHSCVGKTDAKKPKMLMNSFWSDWGQWMSLAQLSHQCKRKISLVHLVGFFHLLMSDIHLGVRTDIHK